MSGIASVANIPEIMAQADLINKILHTDYIDTADINDFEYIRENLRDLIKYIPISKIRYDTNFDDDTSSDWQYSLYEFADIPVGILDKNPDYLVWQKNRCRPTKLIK